MASGVVHGASAVLRAHLAGQRNGLHAGVNKISGDFSLFCEGFLIKDGKIERPVEQITVADNFYDLLKKIIATGSDTISVPEGKGEYFCPSVVISNMNISGDIEEGESN